MKKRILLGENYFKRKTFFSAFQTSRWIVNVLKEVFRVIEIFIQVISNYCS
jgi:hypothetical protein